MRGDPVQKQVGLWQGSPESALIFNAVISMVLGRLAKDWNSRGMGVHFGSFEGDPGAFDSWFHKPGITDGQAFCLWQRKHYFYFYY